MGQKVLVLLPIWILSFTKTLLLFGMPFCLYRVTWGGGGRLQVTLFQGAPSSEYLLPVFRLWLKTIPWSPWLPVVLNGTESGKRDVAKCWVSGDPCELWGSCAVSPRLVASGGEGSSQLSVQARALKGAVQWGFSGTSPSSLFVWANLIKPLYAQHIGFYTAVVCSGVRKNIVELELQMQVVFFSQNVFSHWRTELHLSKISVKGLLIYLPEKGWCKYLVLTFFSMNFGFFFETVPQGTRNLLNFLKKVI